MDVTLQFSKRALQEQSLLELSGELSTARLVEEIQEVESVSVATVHGAVEWTGKVAALTGTAHADAVCTCCRCLQSFPQRLEAAFDEEYSWSKDSLDDPDVVFVHQDVVVIDNVVEESLFLSVPPFPVCQEECRGLCTVCGGNLNDAECGCDRTVVDPRFEALKDLLSKADSE